LRAWGSGDVEALNRLTPVVYDELKRIAIGYMRRERPENSLQPTALVHEAYLKLVDASFAGWQDRAHFFAFATRLMRRILGEKIGADDCHYIKVVRKARRTHQIFSALASITFPAVFSINASSKPIFNASILARAEFA